MVRFHWYNFFKVGATNLHEASPSCFTQTLAIDIRSHDPFQDEDTNSALSLVLNLDSLV